MIIIPKKVPTAGFYYHYKHDPTKGVGDHAYEFLSVGFDTEKDGVHYANYRPLYEQAGVYELTKTMGVPGTDCRPLEMFMEDVTKDGRTFPRFSKITDPAIILELEKIRKQMYP